MKFLDFLASKSHTQRPQKRPFLKWPQIKAILMTFKIAV